MCTIISQLVVGNILHVFGLVRAFVDTLKSTAIIATINSHSVCRLYHWCRMSWRRTRRVATMTTRPIMPRRDKSRSAKLWRRWRKCWILPVRRRFHPIATRIRRMLPALRRTNFVSPHHRLRVGPTRHPPIANLQLLGSAHRSLGNSLRSLSDRILVALCIILRREIIIDWNLCVRSRVRYHLRGWPGLVGFYGRRFL